MQKLRVTWYANGEACTSDLEVDTRVRAFGTGTLLFYAPNHAEDVRLIITEQELVSAARVEVNG